MDMYHSYDPAQGHRLAHDPIGSLVAPRPIGWISSLSAAGEVNLAPYSFFNLFNYRPPIIGFASIGWKDSVANIAEQGEFVWNLATMPLIERVNATSAEVARDVDEFPLAGLTPLPSVRVRPPRVAEAPASLECVVTDVRQLRTAAGDPIETWLVLGEAVQVHIRREALRDDAFDTSDVEPLLRGGGPGDYFTVHPETRRFLRRPANPA